ncbi:MAG: NAD(P)H-binding protein [Bacteroidota bacterium]|nr:NAD(P)H-binding protein [Bacteroidota bacterium]
MYAITGASGHIGKAIAIELLSKGKKIRAISRNADHLKDITIKGGEACIGDLYDSAFVQKAFAGCEAVFCMIPPNMQSPDFKRDQERIVTNFVQSVKANNIKYIVLLSSIGAHLRKGAGIVDGLGYLEERFSELKDINVINLRCGYFMENILGQLEMIKQTGLMGSSIKGDIAFPIVATKDIANVAVKWLLNLNFKGNTIQYVLGQRDIAYNEITQVVGNAIGNHDLRYVQYSYEDAENGMIHAGFSKNVAHLMQGLAEAFNSGKALNAHTRTRDNSTPTSLEEFVKSLKIKKRLADMHV